MSNEKRFVLLIIIVLGWSMAINTFVLPKKPAPAPKRAAVDKGTVKDKPPGIDQAKAEAPATGKDDKKPGPDQAKAENKNAEKPAMAAAPAKSEIELLKPAELILGSSTDRSPGGYRLEVQLDQKGAGIYSIYSSRYDAEPDERVVGGVAVKRPLRLVGYDPKWPPSLALTFSEGKRPGAAEGVDGEAPENSLLRRAATEAEDMLDSVVWDVVRDEKGQVIRAVSGVDPVTKGPVTGQAVVFKTQAKNGIIVTKTFRLFPNADGLEVELGFESPDKERSFVYNLLGPYGIPIEGEWYTGTFRDVVFGQLTGQKIEILTHSASDVASASSEPIENTTLPLAFAGVENQYFAVLVGPEPLPTGDADRRDSKTIALLLDKNEKAVQKSDVGVRITSKQVSVGPNRPVAHTYRVFAGPKTDAGAHGVPCRKTGALPQE